MNGLEGTAELVSNSLTYAIVLLQWILSFFMDSQPEYVIGAGTYLYYRVSDHCPILIFWETSRQCQKALVDRLRSIFGLADRSCLEVELHLFHLLNRFRDLRT